MQKITALKKELKLLLANNTGKMLQRLTQILKDNTQAFNEFVALSNEFQNWKKIERLNIHRKDDSLVQLNSINHRLIAFIDTLQEEDIDPNYSLREGIYERILVVGANEERVHYFQQFFPKSDYHNVRYDASQQLQNVAETDIVLFDDPDRAEDRTDLLEQYLEQPNIFLLYIGKFHPLLTQYPEKAYSANFVISIHARIQEMITFMNFLKKGKAEQQTNY